MVEETTEHASISFNIPELYKFNQENLEINISSVGYSNLAYIQVFSRDVCIDFLEMPGVNKEGKRCINGRRIYMSHVAAQKLSQELGKILNKAQKDKGIEAFTTKSRE